MYHIVLSFLTSFILTYVAIPSIIKIAREKRLMDEPGGRRVHQNSIPTLGGIAIFAGVIFSIILWTPFQVFGNLQYILCAFIIIFLIGAKDDIIPITPYKKLLGQLFACSILVFIAKIRLTGMYGIFGFYWIPEWLAVSLSIFTLLVIVNSFNLIDGINGLSAGLGILICMTFGLWFYITDQIILCMLSFSLIGSLTAFLKYNVTPAKIFMGDTGSLLVGLICGILAIRFIELHKDIPSVEYKFISAPAVAIGILFIPLYDMLRVFIVRIISGKSPFHPDRLHVHHMMLDAGCSHMQASLILVSVNALSIFLVLQFRDLGNMKLLIILFSLGLTMTFVLRTIIRKRTSLQQINH